MPIPGLRAMIRKVIHLHLPVFVAGVLLVLCLTGYSAWSSRRGIQVDALHTAKVYSARLETLLNDLFHKTDVLESIIITGQGAVPEAVFEDLARSLSDGAGIRAIQYLPDGVVTYCYPLQGNEAVMGNSVFNNLKRREDALLAVRTRAIALSGPYTLTQGGLGLVARNPIFLTDARGQEQFWGFSAIILDLPDALQPVFLDELRQEGYAYRLHCQGEKGGSLTIAQGGSPGDTPISYDIRVPNHVWTLDLTPETGWIDWTKLGFQLGLGVLVSGLCAAYAHERRTKEQVLRQAADSDELTGLFNRRSLEKMIDARCRAAQAAPFVLLYMDLNGFKACNDTYGHFWGDAVLKEFARRLRAALGPQAFLARVGGDEFAAVIADAAPDGVPTVVRNIHEALLSPFLVNGDPRPVSASVGWAEFPREGRDYECLMKLADTRMYQDKQQRRAQPASPAAGLAVCGGE